MPIWIGRTVSFAKRQGVNNRSRFAEPKQQVIGRCIPGKQQMEAAARLGSSITGSSAEVILEAYFTSVVAVRQRASHTEVIR